MNEKQKKKFLADRTNDRAYASVVRVCLSVDCKVCIVAKRYVLPKNYLKKQTGIFPMGNRTSRDPS